VLDFKGYGNKPHVVHGEAGIQTIEAFHDRGSGTQVVNRVAQLLPQGLTAFLGRLVKGLFEAEAGHKAHAEAP
jgi:hypothetical protein